MAAPKLTDVPGIGPAAAEALNRAGIDGVAALAAAPERAIEAVSGFGAVRAAAVKQAARSLVSAVGSPATEAELAADAERKRDKGDRDGGKKKGKKKSSKEKKGGKKRKSKKKSEDRRGKKKKGKAKKGKKRRKSKKKGKKR